MRRDLQRFAVVLGHNAAFVHDITPLAHIEVLLNKQDCGAKFEVDPLQHSADVGYDLWLNAFGRLVEQ